MKNILYINAGAGSGKTYRLTHDLADWLAGTNLQGHNLKRVKIDPSEIIVTTFTKAAATEIKERARKVLLSDDSAGMPAVVSKLETATIGTIHSMAQMFINKYWYAVGMVPNAEVMSDTDKKLYRNQSIAQMLKGGEFTAERTAIQTYYNTFRPKKQVDGIPVDYPDFWAELLDKIVSQISYYEIADLNNSRKDSLEEVDAVFNSTDVPDDKEYNTMRDTIIRITAEIFKEKNNDANRKNKEKAEVLSKEITYSSLLTLDSLTDNALDKLEKVIVDWEKKQKKIDELEAKAARKPLGKTDSENLRRYKDTVQKYKNSYTDPNGDAIAIGEYKSMLTGWLRSKQYGDTIKKCIEALFSLAKEWQGEYDVYKKKMGIIDYDDMEKGLRDLLKNDDIRKEIASRYKLVMVDEFQDCNPIQLDIFKTLSEIVAHDSPLQQSSVWVGDPNQAIYGFRGSNTALIDEVAGAFPKKADGNPVYNIADTNGLMRDKLDTSYRSRKALVNLANTTFAPLFPNMVALNHHCQEYKDYSEAIRHWHFLDGGDSPKNYQLNLARKIKEIVASQQFYVVPKDTDNPRLLEYKDIAVLVSKNSEAEGLAHEMKCAGVPVSVPESHILDRIEVQLMLSLLHLSERSNDHEWASVMHLWNNLKTEDILLKSIKDNALKKSSGSEELQEKWYTKEADYKSIDEAINVVKEMPFDSKLTNLILLLSVDNTVLKWGEADTRRQNLVTLQTEAGAYNARCRRLDIDATTEGFAEYLKDIDIKAVKELSSDTVKVVTYHGSKGLEWPMVILSSLDDTRTDDKNTKRAFFGVTAQKDKEDKYEVIVFPDFSGQSFPDIIKDVITVLPRYSGVRDTEKGDAQRLMYVGMTRAREYLISTFYGSKGLWGNDTWLSEIGISGEDGHVWHTADSVVFEEIDALDKGVSHEIPTGTYQSGDIKPFGGDSFVDTFVSPSKIVADVAVKETLNNWTIEGIHFFPKGNGNHGSDYAPMGTCIHNVFAAYNLALPEEQSVAMAKKVIRQHGFEGCLEAEAVIKSIKGLYDFLEKKYGSGEASHEVPFRQLRDDGTIVRGEMDLLWKTADGVVLVDFKNFVSKDVKAPLDSSDENHYVGKYKPQIDAYTSALMAANENVKARLIYYSTLGVVIEL